MVVPWWSPVVQDVGSVGSFGLDSWERPLWRETRVVCGVDEAGRGPLAGPVSWKKTNEKSTKGGKTLGLLAFSKTHPKWKCKNVLVVCLAMFSHV